MAASTPARSEIDCPCSDESSSTGPLAVLDCHCPRDDHDIIVHEESCLLYKNERMVYHQPEDCQCPPFLTDLCCCCSCPVDECKCNKEDTFDEWRSRRDVGEMPAVLESTHPLMQKFQSSLHRFLERENEHADEEIIALRDELRAAQEKYNTDLEGIYRTDHDTNEQRTLIEEYETALISETKAREEAQERARIANESYKRCKEKLDQDLVHEKESLVELDSLTALVQQLEKWREETESDLTVSQRMTDKMRQERRTLVDEKRQLDMIIYSLTNEVWKLESKLELYKTQMEIKNSEMETITDQVIAYGTELEDLDLDKKRLMCLWNSVINNIKRRDNVFDSVRDDYKTLHENYRTLVTTLEITKKVANEEMEKSKQMAMERDKLIFETNTHLKLRETEDERRQVMEAQIAEINEAIEMMERDQELIKMDTQTLRNVLTTTTQECERKSQMQIKMENEVLENLQECLLNDKAVESMANGIRKMQDMSRKLEMNLMGLENQHAKVLLDIEVHRNRQTFNNKILDKALEKVKLKEAELEALQEKSAQKTSLLMRKQRELDIVLKKYAAMKEIFDMKSPQDLRIESLESQIRSMHNRTEILQQEWLRLQGHVVKLATQHNKITSDISLINKQIQICDQKIMHIEANIEAVHQDRLKVERACRDLRGRLEVLERTRKATNERNQEMQRINLAITHDYSANLKDAESELIELEEEIEVLDKEKIVLTQELDRVQREALAWQRKGIQAVELKRNIAGAKSQAGEIGQMKNEIHRMEVRREQLRRTADKLAEDMSLYVTRREAALDRTRATAAVEKAKGIQGVTSQSTYKHKLRLVKADVARVTKDLTEAKECLKNLEEEHNRLVKEVAQTNALNSQLEENVAKLLRECREVERNKQWMLERVVRSQRLGSELMTAVKRQSLRIKKPKNAVITEYNQARALNDRLRYIVSTLTREYPYMEDKLEVMANTLNIYSPSNSPRLTEEAPCDGPGAPECVPEENEENIAEKPFSSDE